MMVMKMGIRRWPGTIFRMDEMSRFEPTSTKVAASVIQSALDREVGHRQRGAEAEADDELRVARSRSP